MTTPTTRQLMHEQLTQAQAAGRIRSFYDRGHQIVVVPLAGQTRKVATPKALESLLASLGPTGRGNVPGQVGR